MGIFQPRPQGPSPRYSVGREMALGPATEFCDLIGLYNPLIYANPLEIIDNFW